MAEKYLLAIVDHANGEEGAARTYDQLAAWCDVRNWPGSAAFFRGEAEEERQHASRWRGYGIDRGVMPTIEPQPAAVPDAKAWNDPLNLGKAFQAALALERLVLAQINDLTAAAISAGDFEAVHWMAKYLKIGRKSIRNLEVMISTLARAGSDWCALQAFDREIG